MTIYGASIIITELLMAAMTVHVFTYSGFRKDQKGWFILTFTSIMFCAFAEYLALEFNDHPELVTPLTIITAVQFSIMPMLSAFFVGALGMRKEARIAGAVFLIHALIELISIRFGWVFYFDKATGHYFRGPFYFIYEAFFTISLIYLIISLFFIGKRFHRRDLSTILMIFVILVVSIIALILFKIYVNYLGISLTAALCYIYYNDLIQEDIQEELIIRQKKVSSMQEHIIVGLAGLIVNRESEGSDPVHRTDKYVRILAENARKDGVYKDQLNDYMISMMQNFAPMHDIGKIVVSDSILKKPGKLTSEEFEMVKLHASEGGKVVNEVLGGMAGEDYLSLASDMAMYHHERWDGTGYPEGLSGEYIPLSARIMAIADSFDALISDRCYRKAYTPEQAVQVINEESGTYFDPKLVKVFLDHKDDFMSI